MNDCVEPVVLIGVDCACDPKNIGIARAEYRAGEKARVTHVECGAQVPSVADTLAGWLGNAAHAILALDAPLGWPAALGAALHEHRAGDVLTADSNALFRRKTDIDIRGRFRKTPLEVGADRIARTAHAALSLLDEARRRTGHPIPLAWQPGIVEEVCAIEVYPAGTLLAYEMPAKGYKKSDQRTVREEILQCLEQRLCLPANCDPLLDDADCLDAVVCLLAGVDFLQGKAVPPTDTERAHKEGWIWVK